MKKKGMLIPGNPAISSYYLRWIEEIEIENPLLDITYASSYVLFSKKLNSVQYDQALREYYGNILLEMSKEDKVTVIAHSAGSYFALRLLEQFPDKIEKVIIIFPYIGYSKYSLLNFVYIPYIIDRFLPLVEFVSRYKNILLMYEKQIQNISSEQLKANLRFGVRQCVYFIDKKFPVETIAYLKDKINFIYTEGDKWCPPKAIELLKNISSQCRKVEIPHGFISTESERLKMIEVLKTLN